MATSDQMRVDASAWHQQQRARATSPAHQVTLPEPPTSHGCAGACTTPTPPLPAGIVEAFVDTVGPANAWWTMMGVAATAFIGVVLMNNIRVFSKSA